MLELFNVNINRQLEKWYAKSNHSRPKVRTPETLNILTKGMK